MLEEPLQVLLKINRANLLVHEPFFDRLGNLWPFASFLSAYQASCCCGKREAVYPGLISPLRVRPKACP